MEKVQVLSFHPGVVFNEYWATFDLDSKHFDDGKHYIPPSDCLANDSAM
jgi:hypothetical protein